MDSGFQLCWPLRSSRLSFPSAHFRRYKKTIICQEVAKAKNVCQVCLLDLDYNIPVQARDAALGVEDEILPESDVGREFKLKQLENEGQLASSYLKVCAFCHPALLCCTCACGMGLPQVKQDLDLHAT